eukprot:757675-Hanusia_phi.AAC.1
MWVDTSEPVQALQHVQQGPEASPLLRQGGPGLLPCPAAGVSDGCGRPEDGVGSGRGSTSRTTATTCSTSSGRSCATSTRSSSRCSFRTTRTCATSLTAILSLIHI